MKSRTSGARSRSSLGGNHEANGTSWLDDADPLGIGRGVAGAEFRVSTGSYVACSRGCCFADESPFHETTNCRWRPQAFPPQLCGMPRQGRNRDRKEALRRPATARGSAAERRRAFLENHEREYRPRNAVVQQGAGASTLADRAVHPNSQAALRFSLRPSLFFASFAVKGSKAFNRKGREGKPKYAKKIRKPFTQRASSHLSRSACRRTNGARRRMTPGRRPRPARASASGCCSPGRRPVRLPAIRTAW
jgi:hypothetical protein